MKAILSMIVSAGIHFLASCILHYLDNRSLPEKGDGILTGREMLIVSALSGILLAFINKGLSATLLQIIFCCLGSMSICFIASTAIYWHDNHALIPLQYLILTEGQFMPAAIISGLSLSLIAMF